MAQYIPKSALVAEIERRMDENSGKQTLPQYFGMVEEDLNILSFIDTLEVKEVDLDAEVEDYIENTSFATYDLEDCDIKMTAKHFFELGMQVSSKAQKGE